MFYVSPGKNPLIGVTYFGDITSRKDFTNWILDMTANLYISKNSLEVPQNFFSEKCLFLGNPIIIKF